MSGSEPRSDEAIPDPRSWILDSYLSGEQDGSGWALIDNSDADDVRHNLETAIERLAELRQENERLRDTLAELSGLAQRPWQERWAERFEQLATDFESVVTQRDAAEARVRAVEAFCAEMEALPESVGARLARSLRERLAAAVVPPVAPEDERDEEKP